MRHIAGIVVHRCETLVDYPSYHRIVQRDGTVERMHHDSEIAFHACSFNSTTLGVALIGDFALGEPGKNWYPTPEQLTALTALVRAWVDAYGPLWLAGHSELGARGTSFPEKLTAAHACPGAHLSLDALRHETGLPPYAPSGSESAA